MQVRTEEGPEKEGKNENEQRWKLKRRKKRRYSTSFRDKICKDAIGSMNE